MAPGAECYVDTAALMAFLDRSDSHHALFRRLFADPPPLCTSALVVAEGHGWFLRRYDQRRAVDFLNFIDALAVLNIEEFDTQALKSAGTLVKKYADQDLTLAAAHGLALMTARRIRTCWSSDRHLTLGGASLVV
jgi:predicted nucleic acid-binding protein